MKKIYVKNWTSFNESDRKVFTLSEDDINKIINIDNINLAMKTAQDIIGQPDGGVCGIYWSDYDNEDAEWYNSTLEERKNHLMKYIALENSYQEK